VDNNLDNSCDGNYDGDGECEVIYQGYYNALGLEMEAERTNGMYEGTKADLCILPLQLPTQGQRP
jgi:hypothetical protein